MNIFDAKYELDQIDKKTAVRSGFCIISDKFLPKLLKLCEKKKVKNEDFIELDIKTPDPNVTFFSDKGVKTINSDYISAYPVGQEPINLAHWKAIIIIKPNQSEWKVKNVV